MARSSRRRERHLTAVVDGHARIIVPIDDLDWPSRPEPQLRNLTRWLPRVPSAHSDDLAVAGSAVSIVLDPFAFTLFVTDALDAIEFTGTHDGPDFLAAAVHDASVDVYVTAGIDVRRSKPDDFHAAAASGSMLGARVDAFAVQTLGT